MTQQQIFNLPIAAGVYTEETERGAQGRWHKVDKVRFRKGLPEKIGGWVKINPDDPLLGTARKIIDWVSLDGKKWSAIATEQKLYLYQDGTLYNITPIRRTATLTGPFATTINQPTVVVTDAAHGAQIGDYVTFDGATAVGGLTIDGEYRVTAVLTQDTYSITASSNASSTATGGGTVEAQYEITVGSESNVTGRGWGTGRWSVGTWGTPRTVSATVISLRTWSLDNWGEDLIASPSGGAIYWWDRTNGPTSRAVRLEAAGTPLFNNFVLVSQRDRQIISFGSYDYFNNRFDPLLIRYCSQEDFNDWIPNNLNTADDIRLYRGSKLITAVRARGEIVFWTDVSMHSLVAVGPPDVFALNTIGENVSILGPMAAIAVDYRVFMMGEANFYMYDGVLRVLPCDVRNYVYNNLTVSQKDKVYCGLNREFNEIWWFYPANDPSLWLTADFSLDAQTDSWDTQSMIGSPDYTIAYNTGGFVELSTYTASNVDAAYLLKTSAPLDDMSAAEFEVMFTVNSITGDGGLSILPYVSDFATVNGTSAENFLGLAVELRGQQNQVRWSKRGADGAFATLDNNVTVTLSTLPTPITITVGRTYGLIVRRSANVLTAWLYDEASGTTQQVGAVTLSSTEIAAYSTYGSGKTVGFSLATIGSAGTAVGAFSVESFRAGPVGTLVSPAFRGAADEVNSYVAFNYEEGTWTYGSMTRTAWQDRSPVFEKPYAASTDGYLYKHEVGVDADGQPMTAFIESFMMELPEAGEELMHVSQLIPDFLTLEGTVNVSMRGRKYPQDPVLVSKGPYPVSSGTRKISLRVMARQIALRLESSAIGDRWRSGRWRGRAGAHGKRG